MSRRPLRPLGGTLLLAGVGAAVGGIIGTALLALLPVLVFRPPSHPAFDLLFSLAWGGGFGAAVGAIVAPLSGWTLLRHVPLGRAIAATAVGTFLGALIIYPQPVIGGMLGYVAAAVLSRRYYARPPRDQERA